MTDPVLIAGFAAAVNRKYAAGITEHFLDPQVNGTSVVRPERVISLTGADFPGSPTRWTFPPA